MLKYIISIFLYICLTSFAIADKSSGKSCTVTKVIDGDTVHAMCGKKDVKVRMTLIDSYESKKNNRAYKQAYEQKLTIDEVVDKGKKATNITKRVLTGKRIKIVPPTKGDKIDLYGRDLGEIYLDGENVNKKLLTEHPDVFMKY